MVYYVGQTPDSILQNEIRYFYALRRTEEGDLYFTKVDNIIGRDEIIINVIGSPEENFEDFEYGVDFFEGRLESDHTRPYENLNFDQYRWDNKNIFYYLNAEGELVARINQAYEYPTDV